MNRSPSVTDPTLSRSATGAEPTTAAEFNGRGMARFGQGDLHGALDDFRAATQLHAGYPEAWNNCGIVRQLLGDAPQALEDFHRALALNPNHAEALSNSARARQALGDV